MDPVARALNITKDVIIGPPPWELIQDVIKEAPKEEVKELPKIEIPEDKKDDKPNN